MSDDAFLEEIKKDFLQESLDLLGRVEGLSLEVEKAPDSPEPYAELARLAHNLKGSSQAVGFENIAKLSHRVEDFILGIKNKTVPRTGDQLDFLFKCLDQLKRDIETLIGNIGAELDHRDLLAELERRMNQVAVANEVLQKEDAKDVPPKREKPAPAAQAPAVAKNEVLRIAKNKVDFLLESFGEQVILQSTLEQAKFDLEGNRDLIMKTISQLTKLTFELQSHALALTMVQIAPTFTKLERAIRDAARTCGKSVDVKLEGGETEVDKTLIESLSDSLTHMVRNSVDHAIEEAEERREKGKKEAGTVWIRARRTGGQLWIEVQDDGKGLNAKMIKEKAIKKRLIEASRAEQMSDEEAFQLIFLNGFSTKEAVSELSGRGVGMNVVQESVANLNGSIEIESKVGQGTLFRLRLPLSLAIFNGAVVAVNGRKFIIPNSDITEINRFDCQQKIKLSDARSAVRVREEIFELIDLRTKLAGGAKLKLTDRDIPLIISRKTNKAFLVDEIIGMQKIVQKPIGEEIKGRPEFVAATILGDGSPGVILNLNSFSQAS